MYFNITTLSVIWKSKEKNSSWEPGMVALPVILALEELRKEDQCKFKASLGYTVN